MSCGGTCIRWCACIGAIYTSCCTSPRRKHVRKNWQLSSFALQLYSPGHPFPFFLRFNAPRFCQCKRARARARHPRIRFANTNQRIVIIQAMQSDRAFDISVLLASRLDRFPWILFRRRLFRLFLTRYGSLEFCRLVEAASLYRWIINISSQMHLYHTDRAFLTPSSWNIVALKFVQHFVLHFYVTK